MARFPLRLPLRGSTQALRWARLTQTIGLMLFSSVFLGGSWVYFRHAQQQRTTALQQQAQQVQGLDATRWDAVRMAYQNALSSHLFAPADSSALSPRKAWVRYFIQQIQPHFPQMDMSMQAVQAAPLSQPGPYRLETSPLRVQGQVHDEDELLVLLDLLARGPAHVRMQSCHIARQEIRHEVRLRIDCTAQLMTLLS